MRNRLFKGGEKEIVFFKARGKSYHGGGALISLDGKGVEYGGKKTRD